MLSDWALSGNLSLAFFLKPSSKNLLHRHKVSQTQNVMEGFLASWRMGKRQREQALTSQGDSPQAAGEWSRQPLRGNTELGGQGEAAGS